MSSIFSFLIFGYFMLGAGSIQPDNATCLLKDHFDHVSAVINLNGKSIKLSERALTEKGTVTKELELENRYLEFENCGDFNKILVLPKNGNNKLPAYFLSNRNNEIKISAYYSRVDLDSDISARLNDWCLILNEIDQVKR